ncbi:MAG TPA: hypothetical protein VHG09_11490, partial [Longimicrobiales bacterium]|nr:hypothetical protein [Longimicrobiales bacterium]
MLNLLTAVHERLGENGGTLRVLCDAAEENLRLDILATVDPESPPLAPPDMEYERSLAVAAALLDSSGASLEERPDGVTVRLPRQSAP